MQVFFTVAGTHSNERCFPLYHRQEGSKVYALHTRSHTVLSHMEGPGVTVSLVQHLDETHVQRVAHFRDQTDLKHFVVVLSRISSSTVYWWNGERRGVWRVAWWEIIFIAPYSTLSRKHLPDLLGILPLTLLLFCFIAAFIPTTVTPSHQYPSSPLASYSLSPKEKRCEVWV